MLQNYKRKPASPGEIVTQLRYAREGIIREEMRYVGGRESIAAKKIREEVARGRLIIPGKPNHTSLEPMCMGRLHVSR